MSWVRFPSAPPHNHRSERQRPCCLRSVYVLGARIERGRRALRCPEWDLGDRSEASAGCDQGVLRGLARVEDRSAHPHALAVRLSAHQPHSSDIRRRGGRTSQRLVGSELELGPAFGAAERCHRSQGLPVAAADHADGRRRPIDPREPVPGERSGGGHRSSSRGRRGRTVR